MSDFYLGLLIGFSVGFLLGWNLAGHFVLRYWKKSLEESEQRGAVPHPMEDLPLPKKRRTMWDR